MGIIFALLYAVFVAFGKNLLKLSMKDFPPSVGFFLESLFGLVIWIPFAYFSGINFQQVWEIMPIVILSAISSEAYPFYVYSKGKLSIIVSVFSTYAVYTILFSHILIGE